MVEFVAAVMLTIFSLMVIVLFITGAVLLGISEIFRRH